MLVRHTHTHKQSNNGWVREKREDDGCFCVEWLVQAEGMACNLFDFSYAPDKHSALHFTFFLSLSVFHSNFITNCCQRTQLRARIQNAKEKTFTETNFNWHFSFRMMGLVSFFLRFVPCFVYELVLFLLLSLMHVNHISVDHLFISSPFDTCVQQCTRCCAVKMSSIYGRSTFANASNFHLSVVLVRFLFRPLSMPSS